MREYMNGNVRRDINVCAFIGTCILEITRTSENWTPENTGRSGWSRDCPIFSGSTVYTF